MDKNELRNKILALEGLTNDEKSALIELLNKQKKYGLVWEDKPEAVEERLREELPVLCEVKERFIPSSDPDALNHLLIEGDNLEALTALSYTHAGKIDLIYIDPPYNTGNKDFIYNDSFVDTEDEYRHSKWLSFMGKRLRLAKGLLSDKGIIFISIDDNELAQLKLLCDEIFGEGNFINNISINMNSLSGVKMTHTISGKRYPAQKESLLLYRKRNFPLSLLIEKTHKGKWDKEYNLIIPDMQEGDFEKFESMTVDEVNKYFEGKELMSTSDYIKQNSIDISEEWLWDNSYRIFGSKSNRPLAKRFLNETFANQIVCYKNNDGNKRFFKSDYNRNTKDPRIELVRAESNSSVFLSDNWTDISNDGGVAQEGGVIYPNGKKPLYLIERIIRAANNKNAIILDFFAGSGTTLHATLSLNKEDGGSRKCILVQAKEGNTNICENITYVRCMNIVPEGRNSYGYQSNSLRYYKTDFVSRNRSPKNMRQLMSLATDMLCIKEDLYEEQKQFGELPTHPKVMRYFSKGEKSMLVIYLEAAIAEIVEQIEKLTFAKPIKVYVFSPSEDPWEEDFEFVSDKVELCALPAAIYNTYKRILPKKKDKQLEIETSNETEPSKGEATLFDLFEEGGKQ